jgi:hypothetical protein
MVWVHSVTGGRDVGFDEAEVHPTKIVTLTAGTAAADSTNL